MPKNIELTVEIDVQKPLLDTNPSKNVTNDTFLKGLDYTLNTGWYHAQAFGYFKDVFYFRKRFQETCALNNICCLLKDETIYCELVQWSDDCVSGECVILAQYLGALNDVLFPPNMCSSDGVDLLMRRSKDFPGILSPKIEVATKVRIDEIWSQSNNVLNKATKCQCVPIPDPNGYRQKPVCHTPLYHRVKCHHHRRPLSTTRSRSRSRSGGSRSCCSFEPRETNVTCGCPKPDNKSRVHSTSSPRHSPARRARGCAYNVYNIENTSSTPWRANIRNAPDGNIKDHAEDNGIEIESENARAALPKEERIQKLLLESCYVDEQRHSSATRSRREHQATRVQPCVCDICRRYHELFHTHSADR
ncbi:unnamed protein product [Parnassius apollo]|uniref:(apollo) hypothetical protein n=1 Tax=Parnassius apollo TaxID=110799 RepID=A0A8S3W4R3_PARAO|nr:unnamed protein product [Parnassius apollo]